jgi:YHS domain-containing protein
LLKKEEKDKYSEVIAMRKWVFFLVLFWLFALPAVLLADYEITQESNGLIGDKKQTRTQKLLIKGDKMKLTDEEANFECIVRLDKKIMWEINKKEKKCVETDFSYFEQLREEREENRLKIIKQLNERLPALERKDKAARWGFIVEENELVREKITAQLVDTGEMKEISGYPCKHYIVKEDLRVVIDIWVTDKVEVPDSVIKFYRESGMLSAEVKAEVDKIKGFPIKMELHFDLNTVDVSASAQVTKIEKKEIDNKEFELPEEIVIEKVQKRTEKGMKRYKCAVCGKEFEADPKKVELCVFRGVTYFFCSKECKSKFFPLRKEKNK